MKKKVRITGLPTGQSGLEVKMNHLRAGLGFNSNVMPWPIMAGKMSAPPIKVNSKLKPIPREEANLEAEKDEVAMIPGQGSIPDTYTIGGKRHTQGGTPLNLPENSFIFSDTAKMRIKDPAVLAQFGLSPKKNGYTPAEIAKKYNTAPYKKILADKNTDDLQRETAELMLSNFNLKLGKLALIQESMKGFPQGIPEIAMPYLEAMQINPEDLMQQNPGAPEEAEDAEGQESAMEIGGPVMAQQPGAPLQYLQDGGPDYFAMGGLKRYQTAGAVKEEPNRYKEIADPDNYDLNNPYHFYNIGERIWDSYKGTDKRLGQVDHDAIKKVDDQIALINSYKETQPEVYKNLLPTLDRLIKSKQQGSQIGLRRSGDTNEFELGEPYVHPDILAASNAYPITPKDPNAIDFTNLPGFGGPKWPWQETNTERAAQEFAGDPQVKDAMDVYLKAYKSKEPDQLRKAADDIQKYGEVTDVSGLGWWPSSNQDKLQDLPEVLREEANKIESKKQIKSQIGFDTYKKKMKDILGNAYLQYERAPEDKKLETGSAYQDALEKLTDLMNRPRTETIKTTVSKGDPVTTTNRFSEDEIKLINELQGKFNIGTSKAALYPTAEAQQSATGVPTNTAAPTGVQQAGFKPKWTLAQLDSAIAADEAKPKKRYGGATKKVRITGLPSSLQKAQYGSTIPVNSPLMQPGVQLDFNNPNYAAQAAINTNYSLDATIPETSPLKKPATKLDFTASDATKPTNTENKNLAYKDTQIKWGPKYGVSGPATAQGIISGMDFISSLGRNKEMLALEQKMKEKQFSMFTPEAGTKGSWVQNGMAYGLQNPNSNIVQQPGYMTMRRNTFGYGKSEFGGAMDQYKLGGFTTVNGQTGAYDDRYPNIFIPLTRADYDSRIAKENAAAGAKAQPSSGSSSGSGASKKGQSVASTIGVYTPEWTAYLTELAKSSGMSIDDPRFKAKLPSYFFDDATGRLKSKTELEKLTRTDATQKALKSGAFGDEYWEGAYKDDFVRRHKKLIEKFEAEHPGETFNPTKKDLKGGSESSHMKWFQEEYNKMAKEKGAPTYDFGAPNRFGRLSYSVPSFEDFEEPTKAPGEKPAETQTDKKTSMPAEALKYKHLAEPRINTPAFGWTMQDMNNMGRAVSSYFSTKKQMPWEATPNFYQADTVFDDPTRRIAAMNEQRNIGAQNMAAFTNPQAYMANFMAGNNLGDVANAISDVHSRNINIANQRDAYNAQALNAFDAERANRETRLYDKANLAQAAYDAEREAKKDVMSQVFNTGMKNAADIYNLNQMRPQFAVTPFTQTMFHSNPRDLKPNYTQEKNLADVYNEILASHDNLNATAEGRKVALEAAKQQLRIPLTQEDPYLEYQRSRAQSQIPQVNPYADQES